MADPMYRRIAEDLREKIESGVLEPGSQLPTELDLREQYDNASRNTVRDAIKWLTTRGLVVTQPGRGTFVVGKINRFTVPLTPSATTVGGDEGAMFHTAVKRQGLDPRITEPKVEIQSAREGVARELGIEVGSRVVIRHQERFIDNQPSSLQTSYYPMEFVQRGAVDLLRVSDIMPGCYLLPQKAVGNRTGGLP